MIRSRSFARTIPTRLWLVVGLLLTTACGPLVMIPGGRLEGTPTPVPDDWSFTDAVDDVQLETNPEDPYSVNVWGVAVGSDFYIAAGDRESQWAQNIRANPLVRLKVEDALYELRAVSTTDEARLEAFLAGAKEKYDFEPDEADRENAALFHLTAR